jgi:non-ribosomal peptide synthetase-like protein
MSAAIAIEDRHGDAATDAERTLAEVLAQVLRVDRLSLDSHFFEELGADSLQMAHFCARVRKRGNLPSVSMRDVYAHPTIRRLTAAVADVAPASVKAAAAGALELPTPTSRREYLLCGALQLLLYLGSSYLGVLAAIGGYQWMVAGSRGVEGYVRLVLFSSVALLVVCAVPIVTKWLLIGRWKPQQIRLWSLAYVRFWLVKTSIQWNPGFHLLVGSPLYPLLLRALGAKVGPRVVMLSRHLPVCTDLLTIGADTVIRRESILLCYRAQAGRIEIGPVTLGRNAFVGERSVLDIDTSMGEGAQLGHASALHSGQAVPAGERWHGSPAQRTEVNHVRVAPARCGALRRVGYSIFVLLSIVFLYVPVLEWGLDRVFVAVSSLVGAREPLFHPSTDALTLRGLFIAALAFSVLLFFGMALIGFLAVGIVPRVLGVFLKPDTVYPLYGFHDVVHRVIAALGRNRFFTFLFGDSSYIVHYLSWLGYRLSPVVQTGSNFGNVVMAANPFLTSVGSGTMVADGLIMINDEVSSTSFRVSRAAIGPHNFVGNDVPYPSGGRTGVNCLLATKVMIPLDGEVREGVGLLGSPPFEIPRSVERDTRYDQVWTGEALRRGLAAKNRFNLRTIGVFLFTRWLSVFLVVLINVAAIEFLYGVFAHTSMAVLLALSTLVTVVYYALAHRCLEALGPPPPPICSIYDPAFWQVERVWKMQLNNFLHLFDGTPFKNVLWRLLGARVGRRVFDDGAHISEPSLTVLGDECVLGYYSLIQCHSQEDGTFKSERSTLGAGSTIGVGALVHYGVTMGDGSVLAADSFLMKGEYVPPRARWAGNPAREV